MSAPIIQSLSTNIGPVGQWVYLAGSGFIENETKVLFGFVECPTGCAECPPVAFYTDVSIGVAIPPSSGENVFKVITPSGEFTSDITFTVGVPSGSPTVSSFFSHQDSALNWVYVAGTNFVGWETTISYTGFVGEQTVMSGFADEQVVIPDDGYRTTSAYVYSTTSCGFQKNTEDLITDITLTTPYGSATFSAAPTGMLSS